MDNIAFAYSTLDPAGSGIASFLVEMTGGEEVGGCNTVKCNNKFILRGLRNSPLAGFDAEVVNLDMLDEEFPEADRYVVLSKHRSAAARKTLSVHHTGNPGSDNSHGGRPYELSYADALVSKVFLLSLKEIAEKYGLVGEYSVTLEATHHGPTSLSKPLTFIEIGSTINEWKDQRARKVVAETVVSGIKKLQGLDCIPASGYGGGHYPVKHTKLQLESEYCLGHILAKYALTEGIREDVIVQSITKTVPKAKVAIIEKKSLRSMVRRQLVRILEEIGVEVVFV
ncbi:MAG: D-aminoacyl-tRNA deacylase [Desulfurococcales archaeon]|nr:D-aminoacyl-tRNA deacylase [Desulfurococcales archaeon]